MARKEQPRAKLQSSGAFAALQQSAVEFDYNVSSAAARGILERDEMSAHYGILCNRARGAERRRSALERREQTHNLHR
jgi:hypothetical protein